ncbi:hypothetical protein KI387_041253, partial [Taxus chinensis]
MESGERECDWLPAVLDALSQDEQDTLQRAGILRISWVLHVTHRLVTYFVTYFHIGMLIGTLFDYQGSE